MRLLIGCFSLFLVTAIIAAESFDAKNRKFLATEDYSSEIEKQIRSGSASTAQLIISSRPRLWLRGNWELSAKDSIGSFAWRIFHGASTDRDDPGNDQQIREFSGVYNNVENLVYATNEGTFRSRFLWECFVANAKPYLREWGLPPDLPGSSNAPAYANPLHSEDELLADVRNKLLYYTDKSFSLKYERPYFLVLYVSIAYDWMVERKFSDGATPVFSEEQRDQVQEGLVRCAEYLRSEISPSDRLFESADIAKYIYVMAGLALYEPDGKKISAALNAKAKQYLEEFDQYWIGKILPALNEQGGSGGWHGGLCKSSEHFDYRNEQDVLAFAIAPILFAHYTATGQSLEKSVFSTGAVKYAIEFQTYMVYPDGNYVTIGRNGSEHRNRWIIPLATTSRRRFSQNPEQRWLGELAGWFHNSAAPAEYVNAGSYDMFYQLMWEEKWPYPRKAEVLGCGTRHFAKLGWVAMRSGFSSPNDLAALFICQRYHWSQLDPFSQNSFHLYSGGWLVEGNHNTILIDGGGQRQIERFPTMSEGVEAYSPGSLFDVGPGIQFFRDEEDYTIMIGDATNAYDTEKLEKFTRCLIRFKAENTFVIYDRVKTKTAGIKKSWVIDPGAMPIRQGVDLVSITNGKTLWMKRLLPAEAKETLTADIVEVRPISESGEELFLHVMQVTDSDLIKNSPAIIAKDASFNRQDDQITLTVGAWEIALSATDGSKVSIINTITRKGADNTLEFGLLESHEDQFQSVAEISYSIPSKVHVDLALYNTAGELVRTLVNAIQEAGHKSVKWDGTDDKGKDAPLGVYFCKFETEYFSTTKKILLLASKDIVVLH